MKKYVFVTNIPTPYRAAFYNELEKIGFNFEVLYMRDTEGDRYWAGDRESLRHRFYIENSLYFMIGRFHIHFSPRIIWRIIRGKDSEIILGGSWNDPNVIILAILRRIGIIKNTFHFWSEANYLTVGARHDTTLKRILRRLVFNCSPGAIISPGEMARITFQKWGVHNKKFISLPNTIDDVAFQISIMEIAERRSNAPPILIMPARLIESVKGIVNFLKSIGSENVRKVKILIAGEGPDRSYIESYISEENLSTNVQLLGHCDAKAMSGLYKVANAFVMPSFSDPSPLTVVEAMRMELPLLLSICCGNHFEALDNSLNGYSFDPFNPQSIKVAFESLLARVTDWEEMGRISGEKYRTQFEKSEVAKNFIDSIHNFKVG